VFVQLNNNNIIKMDVREIGRGVKDKLDLVQDSDQWRALVDMVMNFRVRFQGFPSNATLFQ
jgi:hypothetical protein